MLDIACLRCAVRLTIVRRLGRNKSSFPKTASFRRPCHPKETEAAAARCPAHLAQAFRTTTRRPAEGAGTEAGTTGRLGRDGAGHDADGCPLLDVEPVLSAVRKGAHGRGHGTCALAAEVTGAAVARCCWM